MTPSSDTALTDQEFDQLNQSIDRPKPSINTNNLKHPITFRDTLIEKDNNPFMNLDRDFLSKLSLDPEQENPHKHPYYIPITTSDKTRLYRPWQQVIIIKLLGEKVILNHSK